MSTQAHPRWAAYTDGSCSVKTRDGGWAWVAFTLNNDEPVSKSGYVPDTTIGRMEMLAAIHFLEWLEDEWGSAEALVFCDSEYIVKGIMDRSRARRANRDLWPRLDRAVDRHHFIQFEHVKGHADDFFNNLADKLAVRARRREDG